jgi:NAD-dependent dihydropyrimidine dehydrogenase PreA subunit
MKRAQLNFAVDAVIALAFLVAAVSGVLFLLPTDAIRSLGLGRPGMLGVSFTTWHWLHDWSGVVATVGVLVHAALHYRWIVTMTRRTFGAQQSPAANPAAVRQGAPGAARPTAPGAARPTAPGAARPTSASAAVTALEVRTAFAPTAAAPHGAAQARRVAPRERRLTRRRFIKGAAGAGLVALGGGVVLRLGVWAADALDGAGATQAVAAAQKTASGSGSSSASNGVTVSSGSGTASSASSGSTASSGGAARSSGATNGNAANASGSSGSSAASSGTRAGTSAAALVSVDTSRCVGCGRCLNTCPRNVFSWDSSGSHSTASNAANCTGCRRCLEVCPASAITVNA